MRPGRIWAETADEQKLGVQLDRDRDGPERPDWDLLAWLRGEPVRGD